MNEIKIELNENEKNILTQLVKDYTGLYNLAEKISDKNDRDIAMMDYIVTLINLINKLLTYGSINQDECKIIEDYYRYHTKELEQSKLISTYELEENEALEGIVNKINNSSTKM